MSVDLDVVLHLAPVNAVWLLAVAQALSQGVALVQFAAHRDHSRHAGDGTSLSAFVFSCMTLSALQTALEIYKSWRVLVGRMPWTTDSLRWAEFILNGLICYAIQGFFIHRCWRATRSRILIVILCAILLLALSANLYLTIAVLSEYAARFYTKAMSDPVFAQKYTTRVSIIRYLHGRVGSIGFCHYGLLLFIYQSRTGLQRLDRAVVYRIFHVTWESQLLPMVFAIIACALYFSEKFDFVIFFSVMTGKLYVHGLLRTLNMRTDLRRRIVQEDMLMHNMQPWLLKDKASSHGRTSSFAHELPEIDRSSPHLSPGFESSLPGRMGSSTLAVHVGHSTLTPERDHDSIV
ncbi:hypothetical protein AURDEDRAFT_180205 [Auricularia subglabra TFB-10046 SS5]|nr:hypothetical protein AURDEDRAFT_180205 [Auricularia subglabra TFB-10046 SS5]